MMVCEEDVYVWFKNYEPHRRLELLCCLLNMCQPFELHFLRTCLDDLNKRYDLKDLESKMNCHQEIESLSNIRDDQTRSRMVMCVALLSANNRTGSDVLFRFLMSDLACPSPLWMGQKCLEELLLLYTMVLNHPAFTFQQKNDVAKHLVTLQKLELSDYPISFLNQNECRVDCNGAGCQSSHHTLDDQAHQEKYTERAELADLVDVTSVSAAIGVSNREGCSREDSSTGITPSPPPPPFPGTMSSSYLEQLANPLQTLSCFPPGIESTASVRYQHPQQQNVQVISDRPLSPSSYISDNHHYASNGVLVNYASAAAVASGYYAQSANHLPHYALSTQLNPSVMQLPHDVSATEMSSTGIAVGQNESHLLLHMSATNGVCARETYQELAILPARNGDLSSVKLPLLPPQPTQLDHNARRKNEAETLDEYVYGGEDIPVSTTICIYNSSLMQSQHQHHTDVAALGYMCSSDSNGCLFSCSSANPSLPGSNLLADSQHQTDCCTDQHSSAFSSVQSSSPPYTSPPQSLTTSRAVSPQNTEDRDTPNTLQDSATTAGCSLDCRTTPVGSSKLRHETADKKYVLNTNALSLPCPQTACESSSSMSTCNTNFTHNMNGTDEQISVAFDSSITSSRLPAPARCKNNVMDQGPRMSSKIGLSSPIWLPELSYSVESPGVYHGCSSTTTTTTIAPSSGSTRATPIRSPQSIRSANKIMNTALRNKDCFLGESFRNSSGVCNSSNRSDSNSVLFDTMSENSNRLNSSDTNAKNVVANGHHLNKSNLSQNIASGMNSHKLSEISLCYSAKSEEIISDIIVLSCSSNLSELSFMCPADSTSVSSPPTTTLANSSSQLYVKNSVMTVPAVVDVLRENTSSPAKSNVKKCLLKSDSLSNCISSPTVQSLGNFVNRAEQPYSSSDNNRQQRMSTSARRQQSRQLSHKSSSQLSPKGESSQLSLKGESSQLSPKGESSQLSLKGESSQLSPKGESSQLSLKGESSQLSPKSESSQYVPDQITAVSSFNKGSISGHAVNSDQSPLITAGFCLQKSADNDEGDVKLNNCNGVQHHGAQNSPRNESARTVLNKMYKQFSNYTVAQLSMMSDAELIQLGIKSSDLVRFRQLITSRGGHDVHPNGFTASVSAAISHAKSLSGNSRKNYHFDQTNSLPLNGSISFGDVNISSFGELPTLERKESDNIQKENLPKTRSGQFDSSSVQSPVLQNNTTQSLRLQSPYHCRHNSTANGASNVVNTAKPSMRAQATDCMSSTQEDQCSTPSNCKVSITATRLSPESAMTKSTQKKLLYSCAHTKLSSSDESISAVVSNVELTKKVAGAEINEPEGNKSSPSASVITSDNTVLYASLPIATNCASINISNDSNTASPAHFALPPRSNTVQENGVSDSSRGTMKNCATTNHCSEASMRYPPPMPVDVAAVLVSASTHARDANVSAVAMSSRSSADLGQVFSNPILGRAPLHGMQHYFSTPPPNHMMQGTVLPSPLLPLSVPPPLGNNVEPVGSLAGPPPPLMSSLPGSNSSTPPATTAKTTAPSKACTVVTTSNTALITSSCVNSSTLSGPLHLHRTPPPPQLNASLRSPVQEHQHHAHQQVYFLNSKNGVPLLPSTQPPMVAPHQYFPYSLQYFMPPQHPHYSHQGSGGGRPSHALVFGAPLVQQQPQNGMGQQYSQRHGGTSYSAGGSSSMGGNSSSSSTCSNSSSLGGHSKGRHQNHNNNRRTHQHASTSVGNTAAHAVSSHTNYGMHRSAGGDQHERSKTVETSCSTDSSPGSSQYSSPPQTPSPDQDGSKSAAGKRCDDEVWDRNNCFGGRGGGTGGSRGSGEDSTPPLPPQGPLPLLPPYHTTLLRPRYPSYQYQHSAPPHPPSLLKRSHGGLVPHPQHPRFPNSAHFPPPPIPCDKSSREPGPNSTSLISLPPAPPPSSHLADLHLDNASQVSSASSPGAPHPPPGLPYPLHGHYGGAPSMLMNAAMMAQLMPPQPPSQSSPLPNGFTAAAAGHPLHHQPHPHNPSSFPLNFPPALAANLQAANAAAVASGYAGSSGGGGFTPEMFFSYGFGAQAGQYNNHHHHPQHIPPHHLHHHSQQQQQQQQQAPLIATLPSTPAQYGAGAHANNKPLSCFNCGQLGHRGTECGEASIDEMTKRTKVN